MSAATHIPKQRIAESVEALVQLHGDGRIPNAAARTVAAACGVTVRTIRRLIAQQRSTGNAYKRDQWKPATEHLDAVAATNGNVRLAHEGLVRRDQSVPSLSTFSRGVAIALGTDGLAYLRHGAPAYKARRLVLPGLRLSRNDVWEMDHVELPLDVIVKEGAAPLKPWLTSAIDVATRMVLGAGITFGTPTAEMVRSVVLDASRLRVTDDGIPIGGMPYTIRVDQGREFTADLTARLFADLNIVCDILPPRTPEHKGTVERWHRTIETRWCSVMPGFTHGPEDTSGRRPSRSNPLPAEKAAYFIGTAIEEYNFAKGHASIGCTPYDAWSKDLTPLREVPERAYLCGLLRLQKPRKLHTTGIHHRRHRYLAHELAGRVGETFEVGYLPHTLAYIELFRDGGHVCTAFDAEGLSVEERRDILAQRSSRGRAFASLLTANAGKHHHSPRRPQTRRQARADDLRDAYHRVLSGDFGDDDD